VTTSAHIISLQQKYDGLKKAIKETMKSPKFDELKVVDMKKHKLKLKEEIFSLQQKQAG
jgi:hypothetical protein